MSRTLLGALVTLTLSVSAPAVGQVRLSEIVAANVSGLADEEGYVSDWIELHNVSGDPISLDGWALTDSRKDPGKWRLPDVAMAPGSYLVVFASGKDRSRPRRTLHTNFRLSNGRRYLALVNPGGEVVDEFGPKYPKQSDDVAFGRPHSKDATTEFLTVPTPGAANAEQRVGSLSAIELSQPHGLYSKSFDLAATAREPGVTIRFTLDGTTPDAKSRSFDQPLTVDKTTVIRLRGFKPAHTPTPILTRSYIFPEDRLDDCVDGLPPEGYPFEWGRGPANYGFDPAFVRTEDDRKKILDALQAIPSYSIVMNSEDLFSDKRGIYAHAGWHGKRAERPCSVELLPFDDAERGFQVDCGIRIRGGFSRRPGVPKHGFRLFFRRQYGTGRLKYALFGDDGTDSFDHIDLRCSQNYSWHHGFSENALYVRDQLNRDLQLAMGHPAARGNFRHLYINGHYWGLFNTCERPEASFGESYIGGKKEHFDVIKVMGGYSEGERRTYAVAPTDGSFDLWTELDQLSQRDLSERDVYCKMLGLKRNGSKDSDGRRLLDPVNLIDYMLVIFYAGNLDAPISWFGQDRGGNNWHGLMNRKKNRGFQFIIWDSEHTLLDLEEDRLGPFPLGTTPDRSNPHWLYQRLLANEEFRVLLADRAAKHLRRGGVLTPERVRAMFDHRIAQIENALIAEAARWGTRRKEFDSLLSDSPRQPSPRESGLAKHEAWFAEVKRTRDEYIPHRTRIVLQQLYGRGLYPDLPEIEEKQLSVNGQATVELLADDASIYYTTNGKDPRRFGGGRAKSAQAYSTPIKLPRKKPVLCRVFREGEWGPLTEIARTK